MKKTTLYALCTAFIAACFTGCVIVNFIEHNAITGKGDPETYTFKVGEFNKLRVEGFNDIHYYAAASDTVTLEVQPNLREYYVVEVINNELVIHTTRRINFMGKSEPPKLTVSTPTLNSLNLSGIGTFTGHDKITADFLNLRFSGASEGKAKLDVKNLTVDFSGAGTFDLSGTAETAAFTMSGAGEINALSLETREARVNLSGAGTVNVNCTGFLSINASGMGTVSYKGSPSVNINKDGLVSIK